MNYLQNSDLELLPLESLLWNQVCNKFQNAFDPVDHCYLFYLKIFLKNTSYKYLCSDHLLFFMGCFINFFVGSNYFCG